MVKVAYLILCHKSATDVIAQAQAYLAQGNCVVIHYDRRSPAGEYARIVEALGGEANVRLAKRRRCGWGEWSLVAASLHMLRIAQGAFEGVTHYQLLSGDCFPIKSFAHMRARLEAADRDFIETESFLGSNWIQTGLKEDRLAYRHLFNERERKALFYASLNMQRRLGLKRDTPKGLDVRIGSQWWILRAGTAERVLTYIRRNRKVERFFRTTWIPDETFFQTIVSAVTPEAQITGHPPTQLIFSDYGIPVIYHADHLEHLKQQKFFFARKVTENDPAFRARLLEIYGSGETSEAKGDSSLAVYRYLAGRGRSGRRYAPRFWEEKGVIGRGRELLVIACKKWHVGAAAAQIIGETPGISAHGYVFDEEPAVGMDMGGFERHLPKRWSNLRGFLSLMYAVSGADRLLICVDPSRRGVLQQLMEDDCRLKVMEIVTDYSDDFLRGHAERVGLIAGGEDTRMFEPVAQALRQEFSEEGVLLESMGLPEFHRFSRHDTDQKNAAALEVFASIDCETALQFSKSIKEVD